MAVLSATNPTFLDLQKVLAPDGSIDAIAEILNQTEEIEDMSWKEGNLTTGHRHTIRTALPEVSLGRLYKGVVATKGSTVQVTENTAMLEAMSEVDARLVAMAGNGGGMAFRFQEDQAHLESMRQKQFNLMFKGKTQNVDEYPGFEERYNNKTFDNGDNILLGAAAPTGGDIHSIWLVVWSPLTCFGIVPKGSKMGLTTEDLGERWLENASGSNDRMKVMSTYFRWDVGLSVRDWRYIVRIGNVKLGDVKDDAATGPNLPFLMKDAIERIPNLGAGRAAFYMNRSLRAKLRKQVAAGVAGSTLTMENVGGLSPRLRLFFDEIPVNRSDTLAAGETAIITS
jgi:hypothetical protein